MPSADTAYKHFTGHFPPGSSECHARGIFDPTLLECRCTAGWEGVACERRKRRRCNIGGGPATGFESQCAGNCDEDRGHCYCAGLASTLQRPLPSRCAPTVHRTSRLPDGRPAFPAQSSAAANGSTQSWVMASLSWTRSGWSHRQWNQPFELIYGPLLLPTSYHPSSSLYLLLLTSTGRLPGNPETPTELRRGWTALDDKVAYCSPNATSGGARGSNGPGGSSARGSDGVRSGSAQPPRSTNKPAIDCDATCPEGRRGKLCERPKP